MSVILHEHKICRIACALPALMSTTELDSTSPLQCVTLLVSQTVSLFATFDVPRSVIFRFCISQLLLYILCSGIFWSCKFSVPRAAHLQIGSPEDWNPQANQSVARTPMTQNGRTSLVPMHSFVLIQTRMWSIPPRKKHVRWHSMLSSSYVIAHRNKTLTRGQALRRVQTHADIDIWPVDLR